MDRINLDLMAAAQGASGGAPWWSSLVLTALVALVVGWFGRQATLGSARIAADVEGDKLKHERDKYGAERRDRAHEDFREAQKAMTAVCLRDADPTVRRVSAATAKRSLLGVRWTMGESLGGLPLEELIERLGEPVTDDKLERAAALWPDVEKAILDDATR